MYSEILIEHFQNPRNVGTIENPDGYAKVDSPVCGDLMEIYIKVHDGKIQDIKYRTFGCAAAIASSSMATEMVKGQPLEVAEELTDQVVAEKLGGLPEAKIHCSVLAASALHAAIQDYYQKHPEARPVRADG
ncbi:MAG: iron-sulfur cluster assembly scaffold protein [Chloroflexi bacterium]|nr:iron-sulfur cluster assembly scaffold protein [Chloroflexota bacterium]